MFISKTCSLVLFLVVLPNFLLFSDALQPRIAGGSSTQRGEFPSLASIQRYGMHYCGGSIVTSRWVLTAGHCIFNQTANTTTVVVGSNSLNFGGVRHKIKSLVVHELYRYETDVIADNDIGLILLEEPIKLSPFAKRMKFPSEDVIPGRPAILVGWGRSSQAAASPSGFLKQLGVRIMTSPVCAILSPGRTLVYSNFCTISSRGEGGCYGDSGTPLLDYQTSEQIGIYSWVVAPCATGSPDGYTKVWEYVDWIKSHVFNYGRYLEEE